MRSTTTPVAMFGRVLFLALLFLTIRSGASAQESITFEELNRLLDPYFAPDLLADVREALPKGRFDVWGYDVGDFTGDEYNDLIVSIRMANDRGREMKLYFFADIEGVLIPVREMSMEFVELPIEVGVTVGDGNAYAMRKRQENEWEIYGYRYRDGVVMLVDSYVTQRPTPAVTQERYRNYQNLEGFERYLRVRDEAELFRNDFYVLPSYRRGRHIGTGLSSTVRATLSPYIVSGAYYRENEADFTVNARSAWDEEFLYFNVIVNDQEIILPSPDLDDSVSDRIEIWIDVFPFQNRFTGGRRDMAYRLDADSNIYGLTILLGNMVEEEPTVKVSSTNLMDEMQKMALSRIKGVAARTDSGYTLKLRIPFRFLGLPGPPLLETDYAEIGTTVVVHDVDSPYRPAESTTIATSRNFDRAKPATFGGLAIIPNGRFYGDAENIYMDEVRERLEEVGY